MSIRGINAPGLNFCASRIHADRFDGVFVSVRAPIVSRSPKSVRSGPVVPAAGVPRTVWQPEHESRWNAASPSAAPSPSGGEGVSCSRVTHRVKSVSVWTMTTKPIFACSIPQNSAHSPMYVPGVFGVKRRLLCWPGITSSLPASSGTQKL